MVPLADDSAEIWTEDFSAMNPIVIKALAVLAFLAATFAAGCTTGREQVQDKWDAAKAIQMQAALAAEGAARIKEQSLMNKLAEAQNAATERETKLRADYDAARRAALGLRDTVATLRGGLPSASADACRATADAAFAVFGECSDRLGEVAAAADSLASDRQTLIDAWPR